MSKPDLHRETIRACLRVISTAQTLDQARTQLARMLGVIDKLRREGLDPGQALAEAAGRIERCPVPSA
jgi:hypothetical protein